MPEILIVEDEEGISSLLVRRFHKSGFSTTVAADGEQALQAAQSGEYAAILLDLGLPIKDGWEVLKELRAQGNERPVIVVTASDTTRQEVIAAGANDLVAKPFKFRDLLAIVLGQIELLELSEA